MVGMVGELSAYLATFRDEICRRDSDGWNILSKAIYDLLWKRVQARRPALFASSKDGSTPSLTKQVSEGGFRDTCDDFRRLARLYRVEGCSASMEFTMLSGLVRRIDVVSKDPSEDLRDDWNSAMKAIGPHIGRSYFRMGLGWVRQRLVLGSALQRRLLPRRPAYHSAVARMIAKCRANPAEFVLHAWQGRMNLRISLDEVLFGRRTMSTPLSPAL